MAMACVRDFLAPIGERPSQPSLPGGGKVGGPGVRCQCSRLTIFIQARRMPVYREDDLEAFQKTLLLTSKAAKDRQFRTESYDLE